MLLSSTIELGYTKLTFLFPQKPERRERERIMSNDAPIDFDNLPNLHRRFFYFYDIYARNAIKTGL